MNIFSSIIDIFFPKTCLSCGNILIEKDTQICHHCISSLPFTYFDFDKNNKMYKELSANVNIEAASSLLYFTKQNNVQEIMHQLKYKNHQELGEFFGNLIADDLLKKSSSHNLDIIIPIPLHPKKFKKRGYNQLTFFGKTISKKLGVEYNENILIKTVNNQSQTKKNAVERRKNVADIFDLSNVDKIKSKHILLIDDVMTTGATLESAIQELLKVDNVKVSVITIAVVEFR